MSLHLFFFFLFSVCYTSISRVLIIFVFAIALQTMSIGAAVNWCFRSFLLSSSLQLFYVSMAFSIACGSHFATIAMFIVCCWFLILRIRCINLILGQLIIDDPISDEFLFLPSSQTMLSQDFSFMNRFQQQQQQHQRKQNEQLTSSSQSSQYAIGSNIKQIQMKWLWRKRAKDVAATDVSTVHRSVAKLWPFKLFGTNHDTNEWHHLNKFVNQFNLADIKTIFRM